MVSNEGDVTRNLALEAVRVTEHAALAAARLMGRGDDRAADEAAVDAMHAALAQMSIDGTVRISESDGHSTEKLFLGQKVGNGDGPPVDVALMPVEGPTIVANGEANSLSVVAMAQQGGFLDLGPVYMDKIAVGGGLPEGLIDLDREPGENLEALAAAKSVEVSDLVVCILDRPRHADLIARVRKTTARIMLISDGDVSGVISTVWPKSGIDVYMGIGGAPQGVLAAAALACVGGQMEGRLVFRNDEDRARSRLPLEEDPRRKFTVPDMAWGDVTVSATGVTSGHMLSGVRRIRGVPVTQSVVLRSLTGTLRFIEAYHHYASLSAVLGAPR